MTFSRVLMVWDYYDGPRSGIAEYEGRPHYYLSEWDETLNNYAETFRLSPVDDETLQLALKQWRIWREWELAFHRGEREQSSHPGLPGQDARYAQLESELERRCASLAKLVRAYGEFRAVAGQEQTPRGVLRDLEVEWTPCHSTTRRTVMGMFDWYKPTEDLQCPVCEVSLSEWQGKDGPNALFLWSEGSAAPADQLVDEECKISEAARAQHRLPEEFEIYSYDCEKHRVSAKCKTRSGTWCETELVNWIELP